MPRIRSIKPEFWTSEVVASWDVETRLTFIGVWTYVDDNGVGVANERLIASSIYPMDDPAEALARVREALAKISAGGQIVLFESHGKRLLFVTGWDDHQRVDHPKKARYPRPSELNSGPPTSPNGEPRDSLAPPSPAPRDNLATTSRLSREQGAGSREQVGAAKRRGTRIPEDFKPTQDLLAWAADRVPTVVVAIETEKFVNYWSAKAGSSATKLDWPATWRNWMLNAYERQPRHLKAVEPRPVETIPDSEINADAILGPDPNAMPDAPLEIEEGPLEERRAWYRQAAVQRRAERVAEARLVLAARQQQGSA